MGYVVSNIFCSLRSIITKSSVFFVDVARSRYAFLPELSNRRLFRVANNSIL